MTQIRNTAQPVKLLMHFRQGRMFVFVQIAAPASAKAKSDADDQFAVDHNYKLCLKLQMPRESYRDYHLAFTAATGQVTDQHDIMRVTTRYLIKGDEVRARDLSCGRVWSPVCLFAVTVVSIALAVVNHGLVKVFFFGFQNCPISSLQLSVSIFFFLCWRRVLLN